MVIGALYCMIRNLPIEISVKGKKGRRVELSSLLIDDIEAIADISELRRLLENLRLESTRTAHATVKLVQGNNVIVHGLDSVPSYSVVPLYKSAWWEYRDPDEKAIYIYSEWATEVKITYYL